MARHMTRRGGPAHFSSGPAQKARADRSGRNGSEQVVQKGENVQVRWSRWTPDDGDEKLMLTEWRRRPGGEYYPTKSVSVPFDLADDFADALERVLGATD